MSEREREEEKETRWTKGKRERESDTRREMEERPIERRCFKETKNPYSIASTVRLRYYSDGKRKMHPEHW